VDEKKIIAVVGATGAQGSGLCRAILNDKNGGYRVRALSLEKAFRGAHGAFCVTFFWEHLSPEKEFAHASAMARAAKSAGVKHVIWSTLEDTRKWVPLSDDRMPTLMGKYKVPHFDAKGEADKVFTDLGLPVTILPTSFYWENLIHFGMGPKRGPDEKLAITFPMGNRKLPGVASDDIGKCAYSIFKKPRKCTEASDSRAPTTSGTCSSSSATSSISSAELATSVSPGPSTPPCRRFRPGLTPTRAGSRSIRNPGGQRESDGNGLAHAKIVIFPEQAIPRPGMGRGGFF
jgi:hypothetical protein